MNKLIKWQLNDFSIWELKKLKNGNYDLRNTINQVIQNFDWVINKENLEKMSKLQDILWQDFLLYFFEYCLDKGLQDEDYAYIIIPSIIKSWLIKQDILNIQFTKCLEICENNQSYNSVYIRKYVLAAFLKYWNLDENIINDTYLHILNLCKTSNHKYEYARFVLKHCYTTWKIKKTILDETFDDIMQLSQKDDEIAEYLLPIYLENSNLDNEKIENYFSTILNNNPSHFEEKIFLPYLIKTWKINHILLEKELINFIDLAINNNNYSAYIIPYIIKYWNIDKKVINDTFDKVLDIANYNNNFEQCILKAYVESGLLSDEKINKLINICFGENQITISYLKHIIPWLVKSWKVNSELLNSTFDCVFKVAETDKYFSNYVILAYLNTWKIEKNKIKDAYLKSLKIGIDNISFSNIVIPDFLNNWYIDTETLNETYDEVYEISKNNYWFAEKILTVYIKKLNLNNEKIDQIFNDWKIKINILDYVIPFLIRNWNLSKNTLNKYFKEAFNLAVSKRNYAINVIPAFIESGKIDNNILDTYFQKSLIISESNSYFRKHILSAFINCSKVYLLSINKEIDWKNELLDEYSENKVIYDRILQNELKDLKLFDYVKANFTDIDKLKNIDKFLNYLNIDFDLFFNNFDELIGETKNKSLELAYFRLWLRFWVFDDNSQTDFPINKQNIINYLDLDTALFNFDIDKWLEISPKPWTKKWFLEDLSRLDYLNSYSLKSFAKFGAIIWEWLIKSSQDSISMKKYYNHLFKIISQEKNRSSILQISEIFNLILKNDNYHIFDELVEHKFPIWTCFENFVNKHNISNKWRTILTLLIAREIRNSFQIWKNDQNKEEVAYDNVETMLQWVYQKLIKYSQIIDKYDNLPMKTSIWLEYEVTNSIAEWYKDEIWSDYKQDISIMSEYAWIASWNDAVHEIATEPTDNPYLMILETQLLQDLDFLDLNFKKQDYEKWSRWLHITCWWEYWVVLNKNAFFINNLLIWTNFWWLNTWKEINEINKYWYIREKWWDCNVVFWEDITECVEYRWFSIDKFESLERLILSLFNLNMAKQIVEKHFWNRFDSFWLYRNYEEFEKKFSEKVENKKDLKIAYLYLKLDSNIYSLIENHNNNFYTNEAIDLDNSEELMELIYFSKSNWVIFNIFKIIDIDLNYFKNLSDINNEKDFFNKLESDKKNISLLTPRQREILYLNYKSRLKNIFVWIKEKNPDIYNNLDKYLWENSDELIRKITNKKRFDSVFAEKPDKNDVWRFMWKEDYIRFTWFDAYKFLNSEIDQDFVNKFTRINNLFIKKDSINALAMFDTTREHDWELIQDSLSAQTSIFEKTDLWLAQRNGYYVIQWASEKMISIALQKYVLQFNIDVLEIINEK